MLPILPADQARKFITANSVGITKQRSIKSPSLLPVQARRAVAQAPLVAAVHPVVEVGVEVVRVEVDPVAAGELQTNFIPFTTLARFLSP